jgi:hypothetical protein
VLGTIGPYASAASPGRLKRVRKIRIRKGMLDDERQAMVEAQQRPEITQDAPPFNKDTSRRGAVTRVQRWRLVALGLLWDLQPVTSAAKISRQTFALTLRA